MLARDVVVTNPVFIPAFRADASVSTTPGRGVTGEVDRLCWKIFDFMACTASASTVSPRAAA
jgi:hypothetical protein